MTTERGKWITVLGLCSVSALAVLFAAALAGPPRTVETAQTDFERMESMWNWPGWRAAGKLKCINRVKQGDQVLLRTCRVGSSRVDPFSGVESHYDAAFACSPETCAWAIEP